MTLSRSRSYRAACSLVLKEASKRRGRFASFATSQRNENCTTATEASSNYNKDGVCLVSDRNKYLSWPSEEYAAFAFARLVSPGHTSIGLSEFISVLKRMQLDFNLGDHELKRVFDSIDSNGDGSLSLEEFKSGRGSHPFTKTLVETLGSSSPLFATDYDDFPDPNFDPGVSTAEYYSAPLDSGFVGENITIRKSLDYSYHGNYTKERQHFQDALIKNNVLLDGSGSDRPWYVLTCGPMGAGKGWVLGWMSANGILELERVSKIDPDAFKLKMPEWQIYQQHGMIDVAGTRTHAESSYVAEIAQHVAMNNDMDVWVDGSLRDWKWYEIELRRIRDQYPRYRVAIVSISAPEEMIESNIRRRREETGRDVPEELRAASSYDQIRNGITRLTHLVDLVVNVQNTPAVEGSDDDQISEPVLQYVSVFDRSGNWDLIRELTSHR